ncbi:MAG: CvpA family protein [Phycisphaerae bacterium]
MWFSLFCLLLLGGVAFYQSIHGLFSSFLFFGIALISLGLGFGLYEYVAYEFLVGWKPEFALPIALAACFGVPLVVLRVAMDSLIQRSCLLPALVDRAGGLFFGAITSLICVGVLATAIQMLPFGGSFLKYSRIPGEVKTDDGRFEPEVMQVNATHALAGEDAHVWLSPDRFAAGFAGMLSDGVFQGQRRFRNDHPDLLLEIGWSQVVKPGVIVMAKPGTVQVEPLRTTDYVYKKTGGTRSNPTVEYEPVPPKAGHSFWTLLLKPGAETANADGQKRFTLPQIRLLGTNKYDEWMQLIPCAIRDADDAAKHVRSTRQGGRANVPVLFELWEPSGDGDIEVVFEVPDGFVPHSVTYKTGARASVSAPREDDVFVPPSSDKEAATASDGKDDSGSKRSRRRGRSRRSRSSGDKDKQSKSGGGRVSGSRARADKSFFGPDLPLAVSDYQSLGGVDLDPSNQSLKEGSFYALVTTQDKDSNNAKALHFQVPQGKRLLHLSQKNLKAGSTLGKALNFAIKSVRNYLVTDDAGEKHQMVGQYAIANVDGDEILEVQYFPNQIGSIGRGVKPFTEIKERHLNQRDTQLVFLFLIDQGRQAIEFSTGRGRTSLKSSNLIAE